MFIFPISNLKMDISSFKNSLSDANPPTGLSQVLTGLWHDANGDWGKAHDLIDGCNESGAAWAHAYLHRKEGDIWNADYWYRRAGKTRPKCSLDEEREIIIKDLLV